MAEASEAERFFKSLGRDFDTSTPLRWGFLLTGANEDQVGSLMEEVARLGFTDVEPLFDEEREGRFILGFCEVQVHTARSFAERVALVERFAAREGLEVADFSAGHPA
jgi:hypothetical protein